MPDSHDSFDIRLMPSTFPASARLGAYAFSNTPAKIDPDELARRAAERVDDKTFYSFVDDEAIAKVGVIPMTVNVRGRILKMGGITGVATMPAARRGGHIRALMQRSIDTMYADDQIVSTLYPFKASYYEKFGYAGWQGPLWARIKPQALTPYLHIPVNGSFKQRESGDPQDPFHDFLKVVQQTTHGMSATALPRFDNGKLWLVTLHEGEAITGGLAYKLHAERQIMEVYTALWSTMSGRLGVLEFLARHVDQVKEIRMPLLPGDDPHMWMADDHGISLLSQEDHAWDAPMGRVVIVERLTGIGAGEGEVTVAIEDAQAPWNTGVWTFRGAHGTLTVEAGGRRAEGTITINGLSALVFSGMDPATLPYRGWGTVSPQAVEQLKSIFPPALPFLHEMF